MTVDLEVSLGRLKLKNPLIAASGTFGYGREYGEIYDVSRLGAVVSKSVTVNARAGNAPPRVVETACGMLNSIGLANAGLRHFMSEELPAMRRLGTAVIVNIAGKTVAEFEELGEAAFQRRLCGRVSGEDKKEGKEVSEWSSSSVHEVR